MPGVSKDPRDQNGQQFDAFDPKLNKIQKPVRKQAFLIYIFFHFGLKISNSYLKQDQRYSDPKACKG